MWFRVVTPIDKFDPSDGDPILSDRYASPNCAGRLIFSMKGENADHVNARQKAVHVRRENF